MDGHYGNSEEYVCQRVSNVIEFGLKAIQIFMQARLEDLLDVGVVEIGPQTSQSAFGGV